MESEEVASGSPEVKMNPATKVLSIFKRKGKSGERKQKRRPLFRRGGDTYDVRPDKERAGPEREVYANNSRRNGNNEYCSNVVTTYKYNVLTFLPLFLFHQFKRVANVYFLILSVLQLIPGLSPTGQFTTLLVLIFVLAINGVKEVYEDAKRHRDDHVVNNRKVTVMRDGHLTEIAWKDLVVGDICRLQHKENVPADLLLLATSEEQGVCYVETSSLDGETNLKRKQAVAETQELLPDEAAVACWRGSARAEFPHRFISSFSGTVSASGSSGDSVPCDEEQLLLRGSSVRNTRVAWAMVLYTGSDTKLVLNSKRPPFKRTLVERKTNMYIFVVFCLLIAVSIGCAIGSGIYINIDQGTATYLMQNGINAAAQSALNFLSFFILFGQMIPISLYTSMEIVRLFQAYFMQQDLSMYYAKNDVPMQARGTTLNEELGQISMIFSDKTGTLTQNQMQFRKCVINGTLYGRGYTEIGLANARRRGEQIDESLITDESQIKDVFVNFEDPTLLEHERTDTQLGAHVREFLVALAICHTVVPEKDEEGKLEYRAASPDEMALVCAAKQLGYEFRARVGRETTVYIHDQPRSWEILHVLEFDSDRKRMSVIVRDLSTDQIKLYCKGADVMIAARLQQGQASLEPTQQHLEVLGSEGLRTLMVAVRVLDPAYYQAWAARYDEASRLLDKRKEAQDKLAEEIERELLLIGATAIEDKLQEGVPDAIATLARANLSIYMLTGDKQETAINIGFACSLLTENMQRMILNAVDNVGRSQEERDLAAKRSTEELLDRFLQDTEGASDGNEQLALIVNGYTLRYALDHEFGLEDKFLALARRCKSIICCRVSPAQKAQVVTLHKTRLNKITLAIGDGANDVAMIQAAHVGIGINGEEGLHAVRSADFAIAQFRFLVPLLLIHGRYSYRRITKLIMYFFYKNVFLVLTQFWFAIFNQFTGQSLYEQWTLALYNVVYTSVPIIVFAAVDEDVSKQTVLANPQLYRDGQDNTLFTLNIFVRWVISGIWMSAVVYFMAYGTYLEDLMSWNGLDMGLFVFGYTIFTSMIIAVNLRLAQEVKRWVWFVHVVIWGSILSWFLWSAIYAPIWPRIGFGWEMYFVPYMAWGLPSYWLCVLLSVVLCQLITIAWTYVQRTYFPEDYHIIQEQDLASKSVRIPEEARPTSKMFAPQGTEPQPYTGYAYAPGDEHKLRSSIKLKRQNTFEEDKKKLEREHSVKSLLE